MRGREHEPSGGPLGEADDGRLWRLIDLFRVAALGYAAVLLVIAQQHYTRPGAAWAVLAVLSGWTGFLLARRGRGRPVLVADLTLAAAAVLATRWVDDPARIAAGEHTLPSIWPAAAVLSWALAGGWRGGAAAAVVVSAADLVEVGRLSPETVNNIVLLALTGLVVGYGLELVRRGRRELAAAVAVRSAAAERERLARDIHDSVLQVLSFVQRRGGEIGGETARLGALAGEQEVRLRALVASGPAADGAGRPAAGSRPVDLRPVLGRFATSTVLVSGPAEPIPLPAGAVRAIELATAAALDNVHRHAGPGAKAWILIEDEADLVTVTVRDDGVGFDEHRLPKARQQGRLGVASSIVARIEDVGGRAMVTSRPGAGTEVELRVPRRPGPASR